MLAFYKKSYRTVFVLIFHLLLGVSAYAQSGGSSATVNGTVVDPSGAVIPNATVEIHNPVSAFGRSTNTDDWGSFSISNIPFNPYHLSVSAAGFAPYAQDVDVRSGVPVTIKVSLAVAGTSSTVTVEAGNDLLETDPNFHTDLD